MNEKMVTFKQHFTITVSSRIFCLGRGKNDHVNHTAPWGVRVASLGNVLKCRPSEVASGNLKGLYLRCCVTLNKSGLKSKEDPP